MFEMSGILFNRNVRMPAWPFRGRAAALPREEPASRSIDPREPRARQQFGPGLDEARATVDACLGLKKVF
jgi:hypothetical protein